MIAGLDGQEPPLQQQKVVIQEVALMYYAV